MIDQAVTLSATAAAIAPQLSVKSWGDGRPDVFTKSPNNSILHKFHAGQSFQPSGFEHFLGNNTGVPTSISWAENRLDHFVVGKNGSAHLRFWNWQGSLENPSWTPWPYHEVLLGKEGADVEFVGPLGAATWGPGRMDVVGLTSNGSYLHLYFDGSDWPGLEDLTANVTFQLSAQCDCLAYTLAGTTRFDIFGLTTKGDIAHLFWDGQTYSDWEHFSGLFISAPLATAWGALDLDLWRVHDNDTLFHAYWREGYAFGKEDLGGNFTSTPAVAHWSPGRIDIVGQFAGEREYQYRYLKPYSGTWSDWAAKGGTFASQPAIASWAANQLNVLGIDVDSGLAGSGTRWKTGTSIWATCRILSKLSAMDTIRRQTP